MSSDELGANALGAFSATPYLTAEHPGGTAFYRSKVMVYRLPEGDGGMSWPLAFSTLGCSGLPLADVVELARSTGWLGLELRAADDEPVHVGLSPQERIAARELLEAGGVTVLAVASYVKVARGASQRRRVRRRCFGAC